LTLSVSDSHNAFFIYRNITSYYQDGSLWDRIAGTNGYDEMEGIFPGCYFDMSKNITAPGSPSNITGNKTVIVLGCNSRKGTGPNGNVLSFNHLVCGSERWFGGGNMNSTRTTVGGYYNSNLNQTIIGQVTSTGNTSGTINEQLYAEFGNHLKSYNTFLSSRINENNPNKNNSVLGASDQWTDTFVQAMLFSETEIYGTTIFSSSGFDCGCEKIQLPAFRNSPDLVNRRAGYWLRDVQTKETFCLVNGRGRAGSEYAENTACFRVSFVLA